MSWGRYNFKITTARSGDFAYGQENYQALRCLWHNLEIKQKLLSIMQTNRYNKMSGRDNPRGSQGKTQTVIYGV